MSVRFLADESCDFVIVRALRAAGHDVTAVAEIALGAEDSEGYRTCRQRGQDFVDRRQRLRHPGICSGSGLSRRILVAFSHLGPNGYCRRCCATRRGERRKAPRMFCYPPAWTSSDREGSVKGLPSWGVVGTWFHSLRWVLERTLFGGEHEGG